MSNEPDVDFSGPGMLTTLNYNYLTSFVMTPVTYKLLCVVHFTVIHVILFLQLILITSTSSEQLGRVLLGR